jgi:hypothetical protein
MELQFLAMAERFKELGELFKDLGPRVITEQTLETWIIKADTTHDMVVTLITNAVREVHLGRQA